MALGERKRNFLSKLRDVLFTSLVTSDILQWNGTKWVNVANAVFRTAGTINTGSLLVWNGTELIGTVNTVTLSNADLTLYNNTLEGGTLRVQNNTRSSVLDATSLTLGNDVTLSRLTASVLQVGTGAVPDALTITDYFAVNRQSSTTEREVFRATPTWIDSTDASRRPRMTYTLTDSAGGSGKEFMRADIGLSSGSVLFPQVGIGNSTPQTDVYFTVNNNSGRISIGSIIANRPFLIATGFFNGDYTSSPTVITGGAIAIGNVNNNRSLANSGDGFHHQVSIGGSTGGWFRPQGGGGVAVIAQATRGWDNGGNVVLTQTANIFEVRGNTTDAGVTLFAIDASGNIVSTTGTGIKIGTATGQKLSFWNATPVVQPAANPDTSGATLAGLETEVNELKALLRSVGLMA